MTALVVAADEQSAARATAEMGLLVWATPAELPPCPVTLIIWVQGWAESGHTPQRLQQFVDLSPGAHHEQHQLADERALTNARRAGERLDVLRGIRAYRRELAKRTPTPPPEAMATATTPTPERMPWWRRLFRKAER